MRSGALMLAIFLVACGDRPGPDSAGSAPREAIDVPRASTAAYSRPAEAAEAGGVAVSTQAMPADACTLEGYWSFFETFVREPSLRREFSDENGRMALEDFDVAQRDSRWVRGGDPGVALDINERMETNTFEVEATPVQLDADDDVIRTLGETERYRFEFKDGCWRFAGQP